MLARTRPAILQHIFGLALGLTLGTMSGPVAFAYYADCVGTVQDLTCDCIWNQVNNTVRGEAWVKLACSNIDGGGCCFKFDLTLFMPGNKVESKIEHIDIACDTPLDSELRFIEEIVKRPDFGKWYAKTYYYSVDCETYDSAFEYDKTSAEVTVP